MIGDLIDKILDRCLQLLKYHQETKVGLFNDFIRPIQDNFEALHTDYLQTFRNYRTLIKNYPINEPEDHPIFDAIKEDSIFSEGMRAKLRGLSQTLSDPLLTDFLHSVSTYLHEVTTPLERRKYSSGQTGPNNVTNAPRTRITYSLLKIFEGNYSPMDQHEKQKTALWLLDQAVAELQENYSSEVAEFQKLKSSLLRSRHARVQR